jgi:hypothetical protein
VCVFLCVCSFLGPQFTLSHFKKTFVVKISINICTSCANILVMCMAALPDDSRFF